jgi:8-oxo-dGTP pyrophosphatase MutT (NUDIX family)
MTPAYGGIIVTYRDEVLLCKRSKHLERFPEHWSIPAGYIEKGETPKECAIRELEEETKIKIRDVNLVAIIDTPTGDFCIYHGDIKNKENPILDLEHTEFGYITKDNLPKPMDPEIRKVIKDVLKNKVL